MIVIEGGFNDFEHTTCEVLSPVSLNAFTVMSFGDSCICFNVTAGSMSFSHEVKSLTTALRNIQTIQHKINSTNSALTKSVSASFFMLDDVWHFQYFDSLKDSLDSFLRYFPPTHLSPIKP